MSWFSPSMSIVTTCYHNSDYPKQIRRLFLFLFCHPFSLSEKDPRSNTNAFRHILVKFDHHDIKSTCTSTTPYHDTINQDQLKPTRALVANTEIVGKQYSRLPASHQSKMKAAIQPISGQILRYLNLALNPVHSKTKRGVWQSAKLWTSSRLP